MLPTVHRKLEKISSQNDCIPRENSSTKTFCGELSFHHHSIVARKCRVHTAVVAVTDRGGVGVLTRNSLRSSHFAVADVDTGLCWMEELRMSCEDALRMDPSFPDNEIRGGGAMRLRGVGSTREHHANPIPHCQNYSGFPPH